MFIIILQVIQSYRGILIRILSLQILIRDFLRSFVEVYYRKYCSWGQGKKNVLEIFINGVRCDDNVNGRNCLQSQRCLFFKVVVL